MNGLVPRSPTTIRQSLNGLTSPFGLQVSIGDVSHWLQILPPTYYVGGSYKNTLGVRIYQGKYATSNGQLVSQPSPSVPPLYTFNASNPPLIYVGDMHRDFYIEFFDLTQTTAYGSGDILEVSMISFYDMTV